MIANAMASIRTAPLSPLCCATRPAVAMQLPAASAAVASAAVANAGASFFQLAFVFVCGGLFFSTVVASFGAVYAFGLDNVQRARREVMLVARRTLAVLRAAVRAALRAIVAEDQRWTGLWRELREGFGEAKRVAVEGVEAISLQRDLFAAAVGIPGLPLQQYVVERLFADNNYLAVQLEQACRETLSAVRNPRVRRLTLRKFSAGTLPPRLIAARAYDAPDALAFDVDTQWHAICMRGRMRGDAMRALSPLIALPSTPSATPRVPKQAVRSVGRARSARGGRTRAQGARLGAQLSLRRAGAPRRHAAAPGAAGLRCAPRLPSRSTKHRPRRAHRWRRDH